MANLVHALRKAVAGADYERLRQSEPVMRSSRVKNRDEKLELSARLCQVSLMEEDLIKAAKFLTPWVTLKKNQCRIVPAELLKTRSSSWGAGLLLLQMAVLAYRWRAVGGTVQPDSAVGIRIVGRACDLFQAAVGDQQYPDATVQVLMSQLYKSRLLRQEGSTGSREEASKILKCLLDQVLAEQVDAKAPPGIAWVAAQVLKEAATMRWRAGDGKAAQTGVLRAAAILSRADVRDEITRAKVQFLLGRIESTFSKSRFGIALAALYTAERSFAASRHRFVYRTRVQIVQTLIKAGRTDDAKKLLNSVREEIEGDERLDRMERDYRLADAMLAEIWLVGGEIRGVGSGHEWDEVRKKAESIGKQVGAGTRLYCESRLHLGLAAAGLWRAERRSEESFWEARDTLQGAKELAREEGRNKIAILACLGLARAWAAKGSHFQRETSAGGKRGSNDAARKGRSDLDERQEANAALREAEDLFAGRKSTYLEQVFRDVEVEVRSGFSMFFSIGQGVSLREQEKELETTAARTALLFRDGNKARACRDLGVVRSTFDGYLKYPKDDGLAARKKKQRPTSPTENK